MIFDIRKYSIHDGPGIRTAIFFKGCPLKCRWCHNPEGVSTNLELIFRPARCIQCADCLEVCPNEAISRGGDAIWIDRMHCTVSGKCVEVCSPEALELVGREKTVDQIIAEVERDLVFYEQSGGGVTFTGGEPLLQHPFLQECLSACHNRGLHTVVDTSGFAPWAVLESIHPLVNLFLYDLKLMDEARHIQWTGVSNTMILSNLRRLSALGDNIVVRIPLIPGINDDEENLQQTATFLTSLQNVPQVELLKYHNIAEGKYAGLGRIYEMPGIHPAPREKVQATMELLNGYGLQVK